MNRTAIVTGASSGIGRATAENLAATHVKVLATGRNASSLSELAAQSENIAFTALDLNASDSMRGLIRHAHDCFQQSPSIFVLSAGRGLPGSLLSSDVTEWDELVQINLMSMMKQLRQCANYLVSEEVEHMNSDIVVIGSTVGRDVSAANPVYGATKFALHSLCESLRRELCVHNIRVSLIEPGFVKSGFQEAARYDQNWFGELERQYGPFLKPEDIANTISFVVSQPPHVHLDDIRIRPTRQIA